jgi:hypothetical protein
VKWGKMGSKQTKSYKNSSISYINMSGHLRSYHTWPIIALMREQLKLIPGSVPFYQVNH